MAKLSGKVAVVSGASKGIGAAIAEKLAENGAAVVVNYSASADQAQAVVERIRSRGGKARAVQADVSKPAEAKKLIETARRDFGSVDILVNNAGVYEFRPIHEVDEAHFDRIFDLNVKGLLFATQAAVGAFDGKGGRVINISSLASQVAMPQTSVYSATKAAVDSITRTLAAELGPRKILVNSILPGPVETEGTRALADFESVRATFLPRTPLGRIGQPEDIANVAVFLASEEAGWITGQVIPVAGGLN
ncbi:MAG: SDR family NAD(P)-dependent oxidoreductase [Terriglobia bacterium]